MKFRCLSLQKRRVETGTSLFEGRPGELIFFKIPFLPCFYLHSGLACMKDTGSLCHQVSECLAKGEARSSSGSRLKESGDPDPRRRGTLCPGALGHSPALGVRPCVSATGNPVPNPANDRVAPAHSVDGLRGVLRGSPQFLAVKTSIPNTPSAVTSGVGTARGAQSGGLPSIRSGGIPLFSLGFIRKNGSLRGACLGRSPQQISLQRGRGPPEGIHSGTRCLSALWEG